ncbi:MAG: lysophospholipid acyltransferase family protein [Acidimicrobiales bacterium]
MPPRDTVAIVAYWIFKITLSPVLFLLWRVRVEGRDRVPGKGPAILAANHQSFCDSLFLPLVLRRRVTYVAKAEYFDSWKTGWFFRAAGQIPIRREGGTTSQRALETACEVLGDGQLLGFYPEGTRAPDERLHRGHTGVIRVARACGVPVIPVGISGTRAVQPPGRMIMRPFRTVTVRFGLPIDCRPSHSPADGTGRPVVTETGHQDADDVEAKELRVLTDALMVGIAKLSGQEYVDDYAKRSRSHPAHPPVEPDGS